MSGTTTASGLPSDHPLVTSVSWLSPDELMSLSPRLRMWFVPRLSLPDALKFKHLSDDVVQAAREVIERAKTEVHKIPRHEGRSQYFFRRERDSDVILFTQLSIMQLTHRVRVIHRMLKMMEAIMCVVAVKQEYIDDQNEQFKDFVTNMEVGYHLDEEDDCDNTEDCIETAMQRVEATIHKIEADMNCNIKSFMYEGLSID